MKKCSGCQQTKAATEFHKNRRQSDGLTCYCKDCVSTRNKGYREANREQILVKQAAYRDANKDQQAVRNRAYYEANRAQILARQQARGKIYREANGGQISIGQKEYREANKEQEAIRKKAYYEANRGQYAIRQRQRQQNLQQRTPSWADPVAIEAVYTEARELGLTVDHYYPLCGKTVSGLHVAANLRAISQRENDMKGSKHPADFYGPDGWRLG